MAQTDVIYKQGLEKILNEGVFQRDENREGIKRLNIPNLNLEFSVKDYFPILTTKKMWFKGIVGETLNCLRGPLDLNYLNDNGIKVWDKDLKHLDFVPHIYGDVWRNWKNPDGTTTDQLQNIINNIKSRPLSSDLIIFGDNPSFWQRGVIKSCMNMMQFSCTEDGWLDLSINYRSHDYFLGYPWNVTQYSLVLHIIAKLTDKKPRTLYINSRKCHIYESHLNAVKEQLSRDVDKYDKCELDVRRDKNFMLGSDKFTLDNKLNNLSIDDFKLKDYNSYPRIPAEMLAYNK